MKVWLQHWAPVLALFAAVVALRVLFVAAWGGSVPYWDQWDAEGAYLLAPWVEGSWTPAQLLSPHNEHRLAFSRLLTLALFEANGGHWDNLVEAFANTLLYGGIAAGFLALLRGGLATRATRLLFFGGVLVLAVLPFDWENAFVGFQSQFHFLVLFALATIALAARTPDRWRSLPALWLLALCGLFTMASGLVAPVVAGGLLVLRGWQRQLRWSRVAVALAVLAPLAIAALLAVPHIEGHQALKAQGAGEWLHGLGRVLGWPLGGWPAALLLWLPTGWLAARVARGRDGDRHALFALGVATWVLLQAAAMAWSRGHELHAASSRYTGILALGLAVNGWIALRAMPELRAALARRAWPAALPGLLMCAGVAVAACGLWRNLPEDLGHCREHRRLAQIQAGHVRSFVASGDPADLRQPFQHIPYPEPERLQQLLSNPTVRGMLPWSVRATQGPPTLILHDTPRTDWLLWTAIRNGEDISEFSRDGFVYDEPRPTFGATIPAGPLSVAAARLQHFVQSRFARRPAIGRGFGEARVDLPRPDGDAPPLELAAGARASGRLAAPASGLLLRVALPFGTNGADIGGVLRLRVCSETCVDGAASLVGLADNAEVVVALESPLPVAAGQRLRWSLRLEDTHHPLALWLQPQPPGFALVRLAGSDEPRHDVAPRFVFGYLR